VVKVMSEKVENKIKFAPQKLLTFNHLDQVWKFTLGDVTFKLDDGEEVLVVRDTSHLFILPCHTYLSAPDGACSFSMCA
jgi:hypothetical protein